MIVITIAFGIVLGAVVISFLHFLAFSPMKSAKVNLVGQGVRAAGVGLLCIIGASLPLLLTLAFVIWCICKPY